MATRVPRGGKSHHSGLPEELTFTGQTDRRCLLNIYRNLSTCLDSLMELSEHIDDLNSIVFLTVLEDDVTALLEECSAMLMDQEEPEERCIHSIESRSDTIIEEFKHFLVPH